MTDSRLNSLSTKAALVVGLMLAGVFAGCVDDGADECVEGVCTTTAQQGEVFLINGTRPTASMGDCRGAFLIVNVPDDLVAPHLPPAFETDDLVARLADLRIWAIECPRADIGQSIATPFRMVMTSTFADPVNRSWAVSGVASDYVFELYVNDAGAAETLAEWGLPGIEAQIDVVATQIGPATRDDWNVVGPNGAYAFSLTQIEGSRGGYDGPFTFWAGDHEYIRIDANQTSTGPENPSDMVLVEMEGTVALASILGTSAVPFRVQYFATFQDVWSPYQTMFRGEP